MNLPFCVPEKPRPFYFAGKGKYRDSDQPIAIQDFTLWVQLSSLDTLTSPSIVIATKSRGSYAFMYRVDFETAPPDIFEVSEQLGLKIFYIPSDRFIQLESKQPCVPVPQNNWEQCSFRFHTLAAFYRLNVIPSLSLSLFERKDLFDSVCNIFYEKYRVVPPLDSALTEIFMNIFFALEFFGFAFPSNVTEKRSIDASKKLIEEYLTNENNNKSRSSINNNPNNNNSKNNDSFDLNAKNGNNNKRKRINIRTFAFSEIKFAITNYHAECFPKRQIETGLTNDVFDYNSYVSLMQTVDFVRSSLSSMNMISDELPIRDALSAGVNQFQLKNGLPAGCCDLFTIRQLWNSSLTNECDLLALCRLSGMEIRDQKTPIYRKTLSKIECSQIDPQLQPVEKVVNKILDQIKDRSEAPQWMMNEAQKSVESQKKRIDKAAKTAKEIGKMVSEIEQRLDATCQQNEEAATKFSDTTKILDQILDEHLTMRKEFDLIKRRIDEERNGNRMIFILVFLISCYVIFNFFKRDA